MNQLQNLNEPNLIIAWNGYRMVYVDDVVRGKECNCVCCKCNGKVLAVKGNKNQHHFRHYDDEGNPIDSCKGAQMTALHKMAEQIIVDAKSVMLPEYYEIYSKKIDFVSVELEERNDRSDLQPDIVGVTDDGERYLIEIENFNAVDKDKEKKIKESNLICLEIDVSNFSVDTLDDIERLKHFLLKEMDKRKWINNPLYEKRHNDYVRGYVQKLRESQKFIGKSIDHCKMQCGYWPKCDNYIKEIVYEGKTYRLCTHIKPAIPDNKSSQSLPTPKQGEWFGPVDNSKSDNHYPQEPFWQNANLSDYWNGLKIDEVFYQEENIKYILLNKFDGKTSFAAIVVDKDYEGKKNIFGFIIVSANGNIFQYDKKFGYEDEFQAADSAKVFLE